MSRIATEFHDPANSVPQAVLRRWFVELAYRRMPEAFAQLRRDVLPAYSDHTAHAEYGPGGSKWLLSDEGRRLVDKLAGQEPPDPFGVSAVRFLSALTSWCERWHWRDLWLREMALVALENWRAGLEEPFAVVSIWSGWSAMPSATAHRFTFDHPGWNPQWETREAAEAEIRAAFEARLTEYVAHLENEMRERGLSRSSEHREIAKHLEMLVRWQFQRWTLARLADEYGYGEKRVSATYDKRHTGTNGVRWALENAAEAVGIDKRKGKQGRPRKS